MSALSELSTPSINTNMNQHRSICKQRAKLVTWHDSIQLTLPGVIKFFFSASSIIASAGLSKFTKVNVTNLNSNLKWNQEKEIEIER